MNNFQLQNDEISDSHSSNSSNSSLSHSNSPEPQVTYLSFSQCHSYEIKCPYRGCLAKGLKFDHHDLFKEHHESTHCKKDKHGEIIKEAAFRWKCYAEIFIDPSNKSLGKKLCGKVSNSWYNYAGHITSHSSIIGHSWCCLLNPNGKRKKTNTLYQGKLICGKRTSTKHHLLAHIKNVHKEYKIVDKNARKTYTRSKDKNKKKIKLKSKVKNNKNSSSPLNTINLSRKRIRKQFKNETRHEQHHNNNSSQPKFKKLRFNYFQIPLADSININTINEDGLLIPNSIGRKAKTLREQNNFISLLLAANDIHSNCNDCSVDIAQRKRLMSSFPIPLIPLIPSMSSISNTSTNPLNSFNNSPNTISTNLNDSINDNHSINSILSSPPALNPIFNINSNLNSNEIPLILPNISMDNLHNINLNKNSTLIPDLRMGLFKLLQSQNMNININNSSIFKISNDNKNE